MLPPQIRLRNCFAREILRTAFAPYVPCVLEVREDLRGLGWLELLGGGKRGGYYLGVGFCLRGGGVGGGGLEGHFEEEGMREGEGRILGGYA